MLLLNIWLHRWLPEFEQESDPQIWKNFGPGSGFENLRIRSGVGACECESGHLYRPPRYSLISNRFRCWLRGGNHRPGLGARPCIDGVVHRARAWLDGVQFSRWLGCHEGVRNEEERLRWVRVVFLCKFALSLSRFKNQRFSCQATSKTCWCTCEWSLRAACWRKTAWFRACRQGPICTSLFSVLKVPMSLFVHGSSCRYCFSLWL